MRFGVIPETLDPGLVTRPTIHYLHLSDDDLVDAIDKAFAEPV